MGVCTFEQPFLMIIVTRYLYLALCLLFSSALHAQGVFALAVQTPATHYQDTVKIPADWRPKFDRQLRHDGIDKEQELILFSDSKNDKKFSPSPDDDINYFITQSLVRKVDVIQYLIETDATLDHRLKVNYLKGLENLLRYFRQNWKKKSAPFKVYSLTPIKVNPVNLPAIINAYEQAMSKDRNGESIEPIVNSLTYDAALNLLSTQIFEKNPGVNIQRGQLAGDVKNQLLLKYIRLNPTRVLFILDEYPNLPYADSIIRSLNKKLWAQQLYDFAQSGKTVSKTMKQITDDLFFPTLVKMASSNNGQQYFPFLDNILSGKMTMEEVDAAKDDSLLYYRLLVRTHVDYVHRANLKDTALEYKGLRTRLERKAMENFVNVINGLHNENAELRFRSIQPLTPQELYYLAVSADGAIYTSSFVKGIYPLMMKKANNHADSILMSVYFDKYRRFIKMAAGFNMLSDFLSKFPARANPEEESDAEKLMKAFVGRLENGDGLEDGVNVADSYASIVETMKPIANEMLRNIQVNYERTLKAGNERGVAIYKILSTLFLSADSANKIDLTKELGIPPIYEVPFKALANDSGRAIMQVFIYGDKDGIGVFPGILNLFNNANWKTDRSNPQWVLINSVKGSPVSIYLNKPLPEENDQDEDAQKALCKYLDDSKLYPTVTVNRGHSYNAPYTIEKMFSTSKIVFMGSCGGYRMIHDILEKAPDAHIIGTKQIADAPVNNPFLKLMGEKLRGGNDIQWIPFWKELDNMITDEIFEDYVPPYKNLGALFIKVYKIAMNENDMPGKD